MKFVLALLLTFGCIVSANAGPKEDAFAVIEPLQKGFNACDPPNIVKLFACDAIFLAS
jgi:hypothetical protein